MRRRIRFFLNGLIIGFSVILAVEVLIFALEKCDISVDIFQLSGFKSAETAEATGTSKVEPVGKMEGKPSLQVPDELEEPENTGEDISFDATQYPYRELLSEKEQEVYNQIYSNALAYNTECFTLVNALTSDELSYSINAVFNDHPELFWLNTSYKYGCNRSNQVVQLQLSYGISNSELSEAQSKFDSAISTIVSEAASYSSEIEKELYVHDAIAELCTYSENASLNQSAYSALVSGETVCAGYARAFQVVCQKLGLTCYYLTGIASGGDHAWNIISIDGDLYNVDLTWDDSISESYGSSVYPYFNLTDSVISGDHTRGELSSQLPSCTATEMSYENVYGSTLTIDDIDNSGGGQITEGNFKINEPEKPVIDWRHPGEEPDSPNMQGGGTNPEPPSASNMPTDPDGDGGLKNGPGDMRRRY